MTLVFGPRAGARHWSPLRGALAGETSCFSSSWRSQVWPGGGLIGTVIGVAAAVGILFGGYPDRRDPRLDPIVALRAE